MILIRIVVVHRHTSGTVMTDESPSHGHVGNDCTTEELEYTNVQAKKGVAHYGEESAMNPSADTTTPATDRDQKGVEDTPSEHDRALVPTSEQNNTL